MGRSQRHMLDQQNATASGEIIAQGTVAPMSLAQVQPDAVVFENGMLYIDHLQLENLAVPEGPPGGPLQGSSLTGAIPEGLVPDPGPGPEPGPDPEPGMEPTMTELVPSGAGIGDADVTMVVNGTNFTETSVINFNGGAEPTTFVSDTQITTIVKPSTATVTGEFPVTVSQGSYETDPLMFTFTEAETPLAPPEPETEPEPEPETRAPGPFNILAIDNDAQGLVMVVDGGEYVVGDVVTIEATGNTSVNGEWNIVAVDGLNIVVDNPYELTVVIENKGRVTINAGA